MTRYYTELASYEREGFEVIVDRTYEDIDPWEQLSECFDSKEQLYRDIDSGKYEWFMLRVRALLNDHVLGSAYLGACLYERAAEVLTDGTAEDLIYEALEEARLEVWRLRHKIEQLDSVG
jgi:hypothetical protein